MFGDIIGVYAEAGVKVLGFTYDTWGRVLSVSDSALETSVETAAIFRYRGYIYDSQTQLYYLQSRYYDPNTGRFINADGYISTGTGMLGHNMYAYCNNNPVMFIDPNGKLLILVLVVIVIVGVFLAGCSSTHDKPYNENDFISDEKRYNTMDEAALAAAESLIVLTENSGYEYIGAIYTFGDGNYYYSSFYTSRKKDRVDIPDNFYIPKGAVIVAHIHTHPYHTAYHFSYEDFNEPYKDYINGTKEIIQYVVEPNDINTKYILWKANFYGKDFEDAYLNPIKIGEINKGR